MSHSRAHKEEEDGKLAKGREPDSSAVGMTLGNYATGFSGVGELYLSPSPFCSHK